MNRKRAIILAVSIAFAFGTGLSLFYGMSDNGSGGSGDPDDEAPRNGASTNGSTAPEGFVIIPDSSPPRIRDDSLRVEKVAQGLDRPTSMAFLEMDDLIILQKNDGGVHLIANGTLLNEPIADLVVNSANERGLLGIAVADASESDAIVFLYYTEEGGNEIRNRVYRYEWSLRSGLSDGTIVLDLPGTPGPNHDGGKLTIGPDGMLYAVIGDLNRNGVLQNYASGARPDDTSVIVRVDFSGNAAEGNPLSDPEDEVNRSLSKYYAYGIRNSFGIDFDPVTGELWQTENGPGSFDEINLVGAGFNSGWEVVMGPIERSGRDTSQLVMFDGSHYRDPLFSWRSPEGVTDIEFLNSTRLGSKYLNNVFVGDYNNGNLYYFTVNEDRDGLVFESSSIDGNGLADRVADNADEVQDVVFGDGFGPITDVETGPDGYLYVLSFDGDLYRIVPSS